MPEAAERARAALIKGRGTEGTDQVKLATWSVVRITNDRH